MKQVQALRGFIHDEPRKRNERFSVTSQTAAELEQKGLVIILGDEGQTAGTHSTADGEESSASPEAPDLPQTNARRSGRRKKDALA